MEEEIKAAIADILGSGGPILLDYPDERFGDFATNAALKQAGQNGGNAKVLAETIAQELIPRFRAEIDKVEVAGPGFVNIRLSDKGLIRLSESEPTRPYGGQVVVCEFADPNPFKILHAGHFYTAVAGDAIASLLEKAGAKVYRVNYGGDVGVHVARSIWAMLKEMGGEASVNLERIPAAERIEWMSKLYVKGSAAYEDDEQAKAEINALNKRIYQIQETKDHDSALARLYWTTREWSYDQFKDFYGKIGVKFDRYFPESEVAPIGLKEVRAQLARGVFEESDGAVVFRGEKYALHTRVFITSAGLPTYEAKEVGLAILKERDYHFDRSVIITGNDIEQYMMVVMKALEQFAPEITRHTDHLTHGMLRLAGTGKMSSRKGNILSAEDVLKLAGQAAAEEGIKDSRVMLAAIKYSFLKQRLGGDIEFDPKESVNILGNSGPYLQYAHARACSIMSKASVSLGEILPGLEAGERALLLKLSRYAAAVNTAVSELSPHLLCSYLYDLTQSFNRFYEANRVIGSDREEIRLKLVRLYADRLRDGLDLLGIEAPDRL